MLYAKQYSYPRCEKGTKSTSGLTRHLNVCTQEVFQIAYLHKLDNDLIDTSDKDLEDGSQLLGKTNYIVRDAIDLPTKRITRDRLLASKSSSLLREEWFTEKEFSASTPVSDIKYNHPGLKH